MINYLIQSRGKCPDHFADPFSGPVHREELVRALERVLEDAGFDDIDTSFNATRTVTPSGTHIYELEEGHVQVGKNELIVASTITANGGDPAAIGAASRHGANFMRFSRLREDGVEELLGFILVRPAEAMQHLGEGNNYSVTQFWGRDPSRRVPRPGFPNGRDDDEYYLQCWVDREFHFNVPIRLHGQPVAALAAALPPGFELGGEYDDTADRDLLRRILSKQETPQMANYQHVVAELAAQHPEAWRNAHTGGPETETFIRLLAAHLNAIDPNVGLNGKRGNPDDISDDALAVFDLDGDVTDRTGRKMLIIDCIIGAGGPNPSPGWSSVGGPSPGAWVQPAATVPQPGPPVPGASWEPKHRDLLARFGPLTRSATTARRIAEQFKFNFPDEGWGHKSTATGPPSDNVIARQFGGRFVGYEILPTVTGAPTEHNLTGQRFIAVTGVDHLGGGTTQPTPTPTPTPTPQPTPAPRAPTHDSAFYRTLVAPIIANYDGRGEPVNSGIGEWIWRTVHRVDHEGMTLDASIAKTLAEMPAVPR